MKSKQKCLEFVSGEQDYGGTGVGPMTCFSLCVVLFDLKPFAHIAN